MTSPHFGALIALYQIPSGRRVFALGRVAEVVARRRLDGLRPWVEEALAADRETLSLELSWRRTSRQPLHGRQARELDRKVDRALAAIDGVLASVLKGFEPESPRAWVARALRAALFPAGVHAVTSLSFVEQHETVALLLRRLREPRDLAGKVASLGLEDMVARLAALNARYGAELARPAEVVTFAEVRAGRKRGQANLARITALVLAQFAGDDEQDALDELLRPILEQNEAVRLHRGRRRAVTDVDPATGDDLEPAAGAADPAARADEPAPGAARAA